MRPTCLWRLLPLPIEQRCHFVSQPKPQPSQHCWQQVHLWDRTGAYHQRLAAQQSVLEGGAVVWTA